MQAGAAQQPWGAWGYAVAGLRNRVSDPLHALAGWVMDDNHRGSWPEVSTEAVPAYFSAPAGVVCGGCGRGAFRPGNARSGGVYPGVAQFSGRLAFRFDAAEKPSGRFPAIRKPARIRPAYDRETRPENPMVVTCLHERAADRSRRTDSGSPAVRYRRRVRRSRTASRESFADCRDVRSRAVEPFGSRIGGRRRIVTGRAAGRRIARNRGPRRLIGVGMHRRKCSAGDSEKGIARRVPVVRGVGRTEFQPAYAVRARPDRRGRRVLIPVDLTVLPRFEAVPLGGLKFTDSLSADVLLRNNTDRAVTGRAVLRVGEAAFPFCVDLAPRSECRRNIAFGAGDATLFAPGVNCAELTLPGGESLPLRLAFGDLPEAGPFDSFLKENLRPIAIDGLLDTPDKSWQKVRKYQAFYHPPWHSCPPPMEALDTTREFRVPQIPGLSFRVPSHRFAALSRSNGTPFIRIPGDGLHCKKLYFLFVPLLDNADMFTRVARITVRDAEGGEVTRTLSFPGDLDWSCPPSAVGKFATTQQNRSLTAPPLSLLSPVQADRPEAGLRLSAAGMVERQRGSGHPFGCLRGGRARFGTYPRIGVDRLGSAGRYFRAGTGGRYRLFGRPFRRAGRYAVVSARPPVAPGAVVRSDGSRFAVPVADRRRCVLGRSGACLVQRSDPEFAGQKRRNRRGPGIVAGVPVAGVVCEARLRHPGRNGDERSRRERNALYSAAGRRYRPRNGLSCCRPGYTVLRTDTWTFRPFPAAICDSNWSIGTPGLLMHGSACGGFV